MGINWFVDGVEEWLCFFYYGNLVFLYILFNYFGIGMKKYWIKIINLVFWFFILCFLNIGIWKLFGFLIRYWYYIKFEEVYIIGWGKKIVIYLLYLIILKFNIFIRK